MITKPSLSRVSLMLREVIVVVSVGLVSVWEDILVE